MKITAIFQKSYVTDRPTDRPTDTAASRVAFTRLKIRGAAMGQSRKNQYLLFRRRSKTRKEATNFHCCHRQKQLQTKHMERAGPTLFNQYFFFNIIFILSDYLGSERRAWS